MPLAPLAVVVGVVGALVAGIVLRSASRRRLLDTLRASWGQPIDRERDLPAIASYHFAVAGAAPDAPALDDRTWVDLNLDDIFVRLDRTQSSVGQQLLYRRLRASPCAPHLDAFDAIVTRMTDQPAMREQAQAQLARLRDKAGYDLWMLAQPEIVKTEPWFVLFPIVACVSLGSLLAAFVWPPALVLLALSLGVSLATRVISASYFRLVLAPFRQLGPLVAAADALSRLRIEGAGPITSSLSGDVARLAALRRVAAWVSRDASTSFDPAAIVIEYLNLLLLFDANAMFFGARELRLRSAELLRVIDSVGEIDAAIAVASFRAGAGPDRWTRPVLQPARSSTTIADMRHPLIDDAVPNSIALGPPHGVIVTGSNMSGKSTFLRAMGTAAVMSQTIHTCLASRYESPVLTVRSCIGRADDILSGKSYYIVEVESVLSLVKASAGDEAHLFLFDELFRGTNAVERIAGGEAVLAQLLKSRHDGQPAPHLVIAATHDRELVDLLAGTYAPYHFTDTVGPDGLVFDYRLEAGPATTRNAIALLELSGAPTELVSRALARAAKLDAERSRC